MGSYAKLAQADRWASLLVGVASSARQAGAALGSADAQKVADGATAAANNAVARQARASRAYDAWRARMKKTGWGLFGAAFVAALLLGELTPVSFAPWEFILDVLLAALALAGIGLAVQGRVFGSAIDVRNRISLSKLQMLAWTVLAVAALSALTGSWLHTKGVDKPLDPPAASIAIAGAVSPPAAPAARAVSTPGKSPATTQAAAQAPAASASAAPATPPPLIPGALLLAMGIAATSFVATPLLLSLKAGEQPTPDDLNDLAAARGTSLANVGKVDGRNDPGEASFADIFHGDEVGNATDIDLGKVQQIFITVLLLVLYGAAIFNALEDGHGLIRNLPPMNDDFVKLLAISHASYLAYKAAPKTATAPS